MENLKQTILACKKCSLSSTCKSPIAGDGNEKTKILFIGEAPGKNEDEVGKPFVGRSGKLLSAILEGIGFFREKDYYITNIVKCRPPENRDPKDEEIASCCGYLIEQINTMKPDVIVTLGRFSFNFLVPNVSISSAHGKLFRIHGIANTELDFAPLVLACYHPAVALYNPNTKATIIEDLQKLPHILHKSEPFLNTEIW